MRSRLVMILAIALAASSVAVTGARFDSATPQPRVAVHAPLVPKLASYLGVFEIGVPPAYGPIGTFAAVAGKKPNLVGYYSGWAQPFNTSFARILHQHGIIPFVQIDPTDANVAAIAAGTYDDYLRSYADSVQDYRHSVVIGFGHEMNAPWYSWGYGHVSPATFVAAWRHIVTLFRAEGADNVTWLWTIEADRAGTGPIASWWPGTGFVTWVGIDGYYYQPSDTFTSVFGKTISQVRGFTTHEPILLSETAVSPAADPFVNVEDLFKGMAKSKTLGLVWFDEDQRAKSEHQDWRVEDNLYARSAFQLGVSSELAPTLPTGK
jgi:mannan endo-1,4-beta-mannosidase